MYKSIVSTRESKILDRRYEKMSTGNQHFGSKKKELLRNN